LNEQTKQQVIALGRLGWSLRRIQKATGVRRETAAVYLREAGVGVRSPGLWGHGSATPAKEPVADLPSATATGADGGTPAKPAIAVTTDFGAELATPAGSCEARPNADGTTDGDGRGRRRGRRQPSRRKTGHSGDHRLWRSTSRVTDLGAAAVVGQRLRGASRRHRSGSLPWPQRHCHLAGSGRYLRLHWRLPERQALRAQAGRRQHQRSLRGFDVDHWDDRIVWMWRWSNLRFIGFYLAHGADGTRSTWTDHWHDLKDLGWGVIPIWLPFWLRSDRQHGYGGRYQPRAPGPFPRPRGQPGARRGDLPGCRGAGFWRRTSIGPGFYELHLELVSDGAGWRVQARRLLFQARRRHSSGPSFRTLRPALFPFSIPNTTRAQWDDTRFQLTPARADTWDSWSPDRSWLTHLDTMGCQYDWFNSSRDRKIFHWPSAVGRPDTFRDVDWDMSPVFDPSHPRAPVSVALAAEYGNGDYLHLFPVRVSGIEHLERTAAGQLTPGQELALGRADIGPGPPAELNGFDSASAAAVSRRTSFVDVFVLGQDGFLRTLWMNPQETFPKHPWALNPGHLARRGSPLAAVCRALDQIDLFYISADHHLATQWWSPSAVDWSRNQRDLPEPLVAGGSNIVALASAADGANPSSLDVFYIGLNHVTAYADPTWNDGWQVVHAAWPAAGDWAVTPIAGMDRPAASTGVAAARYSQGSFHVVIQTRDPRFSATRFARLEARGGWARGRSASCGCGAAQLVDVPSSRRSTRFSAPGRNDECRNPGVVHLHGRTLVGGRLWPSGLRHQSPLGAGPAWDNQTRPDRSG
jgi:hypothetical protein